MSSRILTTVLAIGVLYALLTLLPDLRAVRLQGVDEGYNPEQPIAFSHRLHAGELQVDCRYCHSQVETGRFAGVPAADVCMNCHRFVSATFGAVRAEYDRAEEEDRDPRPVVSGEIRKLYNALGLDSTATPDSSLEREPIRWTRIHTLPDFVYFEHRAHVNAGVDCATCHGPVETMERVRQSSTLMMGWCVNCHRQVNETGVAGVAVNAPDDCSACHY
ncbi:MAG: Menaquinone reductase, multiheme cytochrome c subunit [Calditrichaeota bacterium]|nr:Menaquinone reductase, multiheme cytochrome c subunit [Calditrichota bacterium]